MDHLFPYPKMGYSWLEILEDPLTRKLLGHDATHAEKTPFLSGVTSRLTFLLNDATKHLSFLKIGYTSLEAFLQANVTGPPLEFDSVPVIFPQEYTNEVSSLKDELLRDLSVDGNAIYSLTPRLELFWLAKLVMSNATLAEAGFNGRRARMRVNFWHQKLLSEKSESLQEQLYLDAKVLEGQLYTRYLSKSAASEEHFVEFLTERAAIRTFYGDDALAREDLQRAADIRHFKFALTGALGKRTKFQHRDISQLLVLAKSRDFEPEPYNSRKSSRAEGASSRKSSLADSGLKASILRSKSPATLSVRRASGTSVFSSTSELDQPISPSRQSHLMASPKLSTQPENLPLNDDTLLDKIAFQKPSQSEPPLVTVSEETSLHPDLVGLDPSDQPQLFPMDSVILLSTASSISNEKPEDGLTREETMPYALRVLDGGSSNWQVYTQALLVRSRIEGYKSRTMERGLLQLQALVDQVIAETSGSGPTTTKTQEADGTDSGTPSTFLPKARSEESATVAERLKYIYQLSPPLRWELEAELAQRWTQLGGLRSALEIYQRLQMKAEVALCLAATDQEAEASRLLKAELFDNPDSMDSSARKLLNPPPRDAARLLCILGDIEQNPNYYGLAWTVSNKRYARAQRSLGRFYMKQKDYKRAEEAYAATVGITRLDTSTWFALGCVQIQLEDWPAAVTSFTRVISLEDQDAEAWSNLAVALLRLPPPSAAAATTDPQNTTIESNGNRTSDDLNAGQTQEVDPLQHTREALRALRRAATLKRDDARIWDNYLTVAMSIPPSQGTPWDDLLQAMSRVIELRHKKEGENAIDLKVLRALVNYVVHNYEYPTSTTEEEIEIGNTTDDPTVRGDKLPATYHAAVTAENNASTIPADMNHSTNLNGQAQTITTTTTTTINDSNAPNDNDSSGNAHTLPFIPRTLLKLIDTQITPLASSPPLFKLLAQIALFRHRPHESLSYTEKAWRTTTSRPSAFDSPSHWADSVARTIELVEAYALLGDRTRERTGGPVEKAWQFKSRSAIRSVMGKGKPLFEGDESWNMLERALRDVSARRDD